MKYLLLPQGEYPYSDDMRFGSLITFRYCAVLMVFFSNIS